MAYQSTRRMKRSVFIWLYNIWILSSLLQQVASFEQHSGLSGGLPAAAMLRRRQYCTRRSQLLMKFKPDDSASQAKYEARLQSIKEAQQREIINRLLTTSAAAVLPLATDAQSSHAAATAEKSTTATVAPPSHVLSSNAYTTLGDLSMCRVLNGMWQVSGAHGYSPERSKVVYDMTKYAGKSAEIRT